MNEFVNILMVLESYCGLILLAYFALLYVKNHSWTPFNDIDLSMVFYLSIILARFIDYKANLFLKG